MVCLPILWRYLEKSPGQFVADTACEKLPVKLCGDVTCQIVPGPEECHDKVPLYLLLIIKKSK